MARYRELVAEDALMIIGGFRSTGAQEAEMLSQIEYPPYELSEFKVIPMGEGTVLIHYTATFVGGLPSESDFAGRYYVSSIWRKFERGWQLVFNQDVRPAHIKKPEDGISEDR